ncbi:MAG: ABC transporter permease [Parascardovia denticolens]
MGDNQRAETGGLLAGLFCMFFSALSMSVFLDHASASWQVAGRRRVMAAIFIAFFAGVSFVVGYARHSHSWEAHQGWWIPVRRLLEIISLTVVDTSTIFFVSLASLTIIAAVFGSEFSPYLIWLTGGLSAIAGYITFVQANELSAKTIASLLPFFVVSGVTTAGMSSDDHNWWRNNFSQLGDRTTLGATLFNCTVILGGICIIIISYFAVSELIVHYRLSLSHPGLLQTQGGGGKEEESQPYPHFAARIFVLSVLLFLTALCFSGVGFFRYTPHPILHNLCARGIALPLTLLMFLLPWLAPQLPKSMYVVSDLIVVIIAVAGIHWFMGGTSLTNVEALAVLLFMGWFIIFSRQIAAMESDRMQAEMLMFADLYQNASKETSSRINPAI